MGTKMRFVLCLYEPAREESGPLLMMPVKENQNASRTILQRTRAVMTGTAQRGCFSCLAGVFAETTEAEMADKGSCRLPLAFIPDGALAIVISYGTVKELLASTIVCRSWLLDGNRVELWASLGKSFEVTMPVSLGPQGGGRVAVGAKGKRMLRSGSNAKRTFFKSYAAAVETNMLKHDATLSEAYTLFRKQDSVVRLRTLLRRRWGMTFPKASRRCSVGDCPAEAATCAGAGSHKAVVETSAAADGNSGAAGRGSGRWTFDVNHRHGIFEGNTMLNFAVRCGRKKCIEFLLWTMGADTEIADYGGFTPLLNTAWRGDAPLLKNLLDAGARLDVEGISRGVGPYGPLEWAERKNRPVTAAYLRSVLAERAGGGKGGGAAAAGAAHGKKGKAKAAKGPLHADVLIGAP